MLEVLERWNSIESFIMSTSVPHIIIAKPDQPPAANGMLAGSMSISSTANHPRTTTLKVTRAKSPGPRLKVVVRRLPPSLTEQEFCDALGPDWTVGGGRVDWMSYQVGKGSHEYVISMLIFLFLLLFVVVVVVVVVLYHDADK